MNEVIRENNESAPVLVLHPLIASSIVGFCTGLVVSGFIWLINFIFHHCYEQPFFSIPYLGRATIIVIPIIGFSLVRLLTRLTSEEIAHHPVPELLKTKILNYPNRILAMIITIKPVACALSIGTGAALGRESPSVHIGASIGALLGKFFRMGESQVKTLVASGMAAAISAAFNAPLAGIIFPLEAMLGEYKVHSISGIVTAAVTATIASRQFLGEAPAFVIPPFRFDNPFEIVGFSCLGVLSAFVGVAFIKTFIRSHRFFSTMKLNPWSKALLGGLLIGCLGFFYPRVLGVGFDVIEESFTGLITIDRLLLLVVLKMLATSISNSCGAQGGIFGPTLFIGAVAGGSIGKLLRYFFPEHIQTSGAYALVGMASVFGAVFHAPATAILLVFEMTTDYYMILPIMIATVLAASIAQALHPQSINDFLASQLDQNPI